MPFERNLLAPTSSGKYAGGAPQEWTYRNTTDTLADIITAGYFNNANQNEILIRLDDRLYIVGSDGRLQVAVTAISPNITLTSLSNVAFRFTSVGGAATENFAIPGVTANDNPIAHVRVAGGATNVLSTLGGVDQVAVTFNANPGANTEIVILL